MTDENNSSDRRQNLKAVADALRDYAAHLANGDDHLQLGAVARAGQVLDAIEPLRDAALLLREAAQLAGLNPSEWVYTGRQKLRRVALGDVVPLDPPTSHEAYFGISAADAMTGQRPQPRTAGKLSYIPPELLQPLDDQPSTSKLTLNVTIELLDARQLDALKPSPAWEQARADLLRGLDAARASIAAQPLPMNPFDGPPWAEHSNPPGLAISWLLT